MRHEYDELYSLGFWPEDPDTEDGRKRLERLNRMWNLVFDHPWLRERETKEVIDLCAGKGMGGISLAINRGLNKVTLLDVREEALRDAEKWGRREGVKVITIVDDLTSPKYIKEVKGKFDLAIMVGSSHGHFSPWDLIKVLAYASSTLKKRVSCWLRV